MKHFPALLLLCLLLAGCTAAPSGPDNTLPPAEVSAPQPVGLYDAGSTLEQSTQGALRVYPLGRNDVTGLRAMENSLVVFSGGETTTLTLLTGEELYVVATVELDFPLAPNDPSVQIAGGIISYYDPANRETVVRSAALKEISHIAAPEDMVGTPVLSQDRSTLFYCTATALRAWDLDSGIRRCVKEMAYPEQTVAGLHADDSVVEVQVQEDGKLRTLLISSDNGLLLHEQTGPMDILTQDGTYYVTFPTGSVSALLFGSQADSPRALTPGDITATTTLLETREAAVAVSQDGTLSYYDLPSGRCRSVLALTQDRIPTAVEDSSDGKLYLLCPDIDYDCFCLYRWDTQADSGDTTVYTGAYYTREDPDLAGLAQCREYAQSLGRKYGVRILVGEDATAVEPWDYNFESEYLVPVLRYELELLDTRLSQFPQQMLSDTAAHFSSLTIALVRQLTGSAESGSLDVATGVQFQEDGDVYVVYAAGKYAEHALYHELFHVMETHIWGKSIAFDQWDSLNPEGFLYDYDYRTNAQRDGSAYLRGKDRAFIDTYSMSYPNEDRARVMEYAMLPGNAHLFQSKTMQAKLLALCQGIREAYGLTRSPETYIWEQYLDTPLAYSE